MCLNIRLKGLPLRLPLRTGLGSLDEKTSQNRQGQGTLTSTRPRLSQYRTILESLKRAKECERMAA